MKTTNWKAIAELIGVTAIVASLIFVGLQMQQDRLLMRSELGAASQEFSADIELTLADPEVSSTWAKMLVSPQDLSAEEMTQVNSVLSSLRRLLLRECYLVAMEVFGECESLVRGQAARYFGNQYAQSWWHVIHTSELGKGDPYGTAGLIDEIVTSVDVSASSSLLEKIRAGL